MIDLRGLTKRYASGRGIFDLTFTVQEGEVFGYLGPNGAGKSTTIRHLMGFLRPDSGGAKIRDMDAWQHASQIQRFVGYLPGEIAFLDDMTGREFINLLAGMKGMTGNRRKNQLLDMFELDARTPIRRMSKGMKQKVGIVVAFMNEPEVLILDEPTSGLDPLMQQRFLELILEEKQRGTTILMSSHNFPEVERVCDRVGIVKDGRLLAVENIIHLQSMQRKVFSVVLEDPSQVGILRSSGCLIVSEEENEVEVEVQGNYNDFVRALAKCDVRNLRVHELNLEQVFMHYYKREGAEVK